MNSELEKNLPDATLPEQKVEPIQKVEPSVQKVEPAFQKQDPPPPTNNSSVGFNPDLMNLIITENRLQNTELRMAMMKMSDKVDKLLEKNQTQNQNPNQNQNPSENNKTL